MLKIVHAYIKTITKINKALFILASVLMLFIVPSMMIDVISRYVFNSPTVWGMEFAVLLFGPYFLLGGPYLLHIGGHVNLDLVRVRMPEKLGIVVDFINQLIIIFFCTVLLIYSLPLVEQSIAYGETTFSAWNPPLWPYKIAVPVSLCLLALQSIADVIQKYLGEPNEDTI